MAIKLVSCVKLIGALKQCSVVITKIKVTERTKLRTILINSLIKSRLIVAIVAVEK